MDNYIMITFSNAGVFYNNCESKIVGKTKKNSDDYVIYSKNDTKLKPINNIVTSTRITLDEDKSNYDIVRKHNVENLLHVFLNKRPVPKYRNVIYSHDQNILNTIKNNIYVKVDLLPNNSFKDPLLEYNRELIKKNKSSWNSFNGSITPSWNLLKEYLIDRKDIYNKIINILNDNYNFNDKNSKLSDIREYFINNESECLNFINLCGDNKINKSIATYFTMSKKHNFSFNFNKFGQRNNISGISSTYAYYIEDKFHKDTSNFFRINGTILVKVDQNYLNELNENGKLYANFLDGGLAKIVKIIPEYRINTTNYIKL